MTRYYINADKDVTITIGITPVTPWDLSKAF